MPVPMTPCIIRKGAVVTVPLNKLDDLVDEVPYILKIDVEGHELAVSVPPPSFAELRWDTHVGPCWLMGCFPPFLSLYLSHANPFYRTSVTSYGHWQAMWPHQAL